MSFKRLSVPVLTVAFLMFGSHSIKTAFGQNINSIKSPSATIIYSVKSGDTLSAIALKFHTTVDKIVNLNLIPDPNLIFDGEQLQVPSSTVNLPTTAKAMKFTLTAYTAGYESTGKYPGEPGYGITATGQKAVQGLSIAVDPEVVPYGTPVYIPGVGVRIADDTGGAIVGNRIDVFYNSLQTAIDFGIKRNVTVYLLPKQDVTFLGEFPVLRANIEEPGTSRLAQKTVQVARAVAKPIETIKEKIMNNTDTALNVNLTANRLRQRGANLAERTLPNTNTAAQTVITSETTDVLSAFDITLERNIWIPMLQNLKT